MNIPTLITAHQLVQLSQQLLIVVMPTHSNCFVHHQKITKVLRTLFVIQFHGYKYLAVCLVQRIHSSSTLIPLFRLIGDH